MATRKSSTADTERLDDASIERVIAHLENKGTKKEACEILGIKYNTTRLASIIDKYLEKKKNDELRRAEKRGKPATEGEINYSIQAYLEGSTVDHISSSLYRTPYFVKRILEDYGVPIRQSAHSYFSPELVPEEAMVDKFDIGEKVYSMRYDSLAVIKGPLFKGAYLIYLLSDKWQQFAYQPVYELASLKHLTIKGIQI